MDDIGYSGQLYNNKTHTIKVRTGDDILNAAKDAVCGELMVAKGGQFPGLYIATKTSGEDIELCRISETISENKLPIDHNYSLKFVKGDYLELNSTVTITGEFTLSYWFKPENEQEGAVFWGNGKYINHYGPRYGNKLVIRNMGTLTTSEGSVMPGEWNHVFFTRDSDNFTKIILNGDIALTSENPHADDISFSEISLPNQAASYAGHVDEFAYWDSDQSENFSAIYNNGKPVDLSFYSPTHLWRMGDAENGSGSTITDQGSGGNDLTIHGATFSPDTPYNNSSLKFNGVDNYLDTGSTFSDTFNKDFSISLWFKGNTQIGENVYSYMAQRDDTAPRKQLFWMFRVNSSFSIRYRVDDSQSDQLTLNATVPEDNEWHHLGATFRQVDSDVQGMLYLDGELKQSGIVPMFMSDYSCPVNLTIGARNYLDGSQDGHLLGNLDEISIFDRLLFRTEIEAIYNNGSPTNLYRHNPLHWWRMGENDPENPATITDQGRGNINPTIMGTIDDSTDTPTNSSPFSRYSLEFDGVDDNVSTDLSVGGKSALTVSAWVNMATIQDSGFVQQYAGTGTNRTFRIIYASGGFWFQCYTSEGITEATVTNATPATNQWIHLVGTFDGTKAEIYVDNTRGTDGTTLASTTLHSASSNVEIGGSSGLNMFTDGLIDEVAIWDVALANNEREYLYNNGRPGDISSLQPLGFWRMGDNDNGTGSTITDQGSGGNDGTINGATFSTDTPSI
jgi:hypothetical protein